MSFLWKALVMAEWSAIHPYTESNVRAYVPPKAGRYELLGRNKQRYHVVHNGRSSNLQWRLLRHLKPNEPDLVIKAFLRDFRCFFRFKETSPASKEAQVEKTQPSNT